MHIVYCRLETVDNNILDFNFEQQLKLNKKDYDLVSRAYLYILYYFSTKNEMSDLDLEFYDLYSPPFVKGVFIFKYNDDKFLKLNYTDSPVSYQLSEFFPELGESTIISTNEREIYNILVKDYKIETWNNYKLIYSIFTPEEKSDDDDNKLSLVTSYGDDYTTDNDTNEENSLSLGSSSVTYEEYAEIPSSSVNFDKYSIKERRKLLEEYKSNLKEALEIKDLKSSLEKIKKKLKYYSGIKKEIDNLNVIIEKKEKERSEFKDIHWMSQNLYNQMNIYIKKKKKFEDDMVAYKQKLEKNQKDIESIIPDNIFKNVVFMPSFLLAVSTFVMSWIMREQFWYLAGVSIVFFTVSFYYLWGYLDYIEYIIKLRREKNFYEKKIVKVEKEFKKEFGALETILKKENVEDINIPIERYETLKEFDRKLEIKKEELQTFIAQKFSDDTQVKFENLINEKNVLINKLKTFDNLDLNYKEIEYDIIELKKSIKEYEKQELDEFSLDDDEEIAEEPTIELEPKENLEYKYELNKLKYYFTELKKYFTEEISEVYNKIRKDFLDILSFSTHYKFSLDIDFENNEFLFLSEKEIEWDLKQDKKFKILLQYALIKYLSSQNSLTVFVDLQKLNKDYGILFSTYLDELSESQIVYTE